MKHLVILLLVIHIVYIVSYLVRLRSQSREKKVTKVLLPTMTPSWKTYRNACVSLDVKVGSNGPVVHGSGFFLTMDGYIVTAGHVIFSVYVTDPDDIVIYVTMSDGTVQVAEIIGVDLRADVIVLKVNTSLGITIDLDHGHQPSVGDTVTLVGNAFSMDPLSVASGQVRNPNWKDPWSQILLPCVLTDISTSPGTSGAPIFDRRGRLVAMHLAALHPIRPKDLVEESASDSPTEEEDILDEELLEDGSTLEITPVPLEITPVPLKILVPESPQGLQSGSTTELAELLDTQYINEE